MAARTRQPAARLQVRGARQNNLRGIDLDLPLNELIVVTGVSGSGKSSLAFDTIYAEGQRRYVETFSAYARQFLDRMDKPAVDAVTGIPPAIAIDQANPVRTSRSTVGTMTELNDHLKLLFARAAALYCSGCGERVSRDDPDGIFDRLLAGVTDRDDAAEPRVIVTFAVAVPHNFAAAEVASYLQRQGYTRFMEASDKAFVVVQDRFRLNADNRSRAVEAFEAALEVGRGEFAVHLDAAAPLRFSNRLHCAGCDIDYSAVTPNSFSFNSPVGACDTCRGFGRTMGIDYDLVIPDPALSLSAGAVKPLQTKTYRKYHNELLRYAAAHGIDVTLPWEQLSAVDRAWVIEGEGRRRQKKWFGLSRFFAWLESKSYRMHIRVLLAKYRSYDVCAACAGTRLKPESLLWRIPGTALGLPPLNIHAVQLLSLEQAGRLFAEFRLPPPLDTAAEQLMEEIRSRLRYLIDVGLGYLTLDRQSRTLSGGEVQRINLTTALGASLVNTLFVLDEPSIGLHARDIGRLVGILHRLRDAGNTLLVVEHDAQIMLAADRIIDVGPGPGQLGGRVIFNGPPRALLQADTLTGRFLRGTETVAARTGAAPFRQGKLTLSGAAQHNLKAIDVEFPLGCLVAITGVSGSGKSTLVEDTLYRALARTYGEAVDPPGRFTALHGAEQLDGVVLVDQSPIGKTTRSNPASYVGAFEGIRKVFAEEPLARERGYTAGTFSFNAGNGRCPMCSGNGFERIEMQFLSDVYLRCASCNGSRYRRPILDVVHAPPSAQPRNIAEVLELTVTEAIGFFAARRDIVERLEPLEAVGLGYVRLGQSVPTLSGGEAQRLKLGGYIAASRTRRRGPGEHLLFIFDEPTTGLHLADVARLAGALAEIVAAGHSVIIIEHNLELISVADWVVDLGPDGGDGGGEVIICGTPAAVAASGHGATALALQSMQPGVPAAGPTHARPAVRAAGNRIDIVGAREHNLRNVSVTVPRDRLTVITGVSGSGKSTVAFDILFAEGQRRYLESLNAYARQFAAPASRPEVDAVHGIPPTVAIEQRTSRGGRKSTVATVTELYHYLRLLFVKLGQQHCPQCEVAIAAQSEAQILTSIQDRYAGKRVRLLSPLVLGRKGYYTDLARWAARRKFAELLVDGELLPTDPWPRLDRFREHDIFLPVAECAVTAAEEQALAHALHAALAHGKGVVHVVSQVMNQWAFDRAELFSTERVCPRCEQSFEALDPRLFSFNSRHGWCSRCYGTGLEIAGFSDEETGEESRWLEEEGQPPCRQCAGRRLRPEALAVRFAGRSIDALTAMSVSEAGRFFAGLSLPARAAAIAADVLGELGSRLAFLAHVGLDYLTLDRAAPTLSGGEAQRIRLAAQLGSNLRGVCYVLDEPTIGLHARDNAQLLDTLVQLRERGNTVVVVEHDEDTIRRAEHIIDLGPGAGKQGGEVVMSGSLKQLLRSRRSLTGQMLATPLVHPLFTPRRRQRDNQLLLAGVRRNNLDGIAVSVPLNILVGIGGVSGSGKSTLIRDVLVSNLGRLLSRSRAADEAALSGCDSLDGWQGIDRLLEVDQSPIGKTPRSCPATYVGIWADIRKVFAETTESRLRGYTAQRFSFNTGPGRCDSCDGQGMQRVSMSFLADVSVQCERCEGRRFAAATLEVKYRGCSIADVLAMSIDEARTFFAAHPKVSHALELLCDVGLGYLSLGQPSPSLSGGEAQRLKLVTELARGRNSGHALYVLDEPTIGLHMADVEKLLRVLHRLVDAGHSVIVIEHNLDVLAEVDWLIDMGPEGGSGGGRVVAEGQPARLARRRRHTHTTRALARFAGS